VHVTWTESRMYSARLAGFAQCMPAEKLGAFGGVIRWFRNKQRNIIPLRVIIVHLAGLIYIYKLERAVWASSGLVSSRASVLRKLRKPNIEAFVGAREWRGWAGWGERALSARDSKGWRASESSRDDEGGVATSIAPEIPTFRCRGLAVLPFSFLCPSRLSLPSSSPILACRRLLARVCKGCAHEWHWDPLSTPSYLSAFDAHGNTCASYARITHVSVSAYSVRSTFTPARQHSIVLGITEWISYAATLTLAKKPHQV